MKRMIAVALALVLLTLAPALSGQAGRGRDHWVGAWTTALIGRPPYPQTTAQPTPATTQGRMTFPKNQTLRQIVRTSLGGDRVRVTLSNAFGTAPLTIGAAHIARRQKDAAIVAASDRALTFSGSADTTIPAGAVMVSDPVALAVPAFADLAIDLYLPGDTDGQSLTVHRAALQTSYLSPAGNHAGEPDMPAATKTTAWYFLEAVEVSAPDRTAVVVALGDSITDGAGSTVDANHRWPDYLAQRLMERNNGAKLAVLNAGIGGNRILTQELPEFGINILARFDRDVLLQPGVTHVVVLEGINDIGMARESATPTAADLIAGHKQLIERARTHGLKIFGGTLTPFEGAQYYTTVGEAKRQAVNDWIRTSKAYDGVIDFDAAVRDPLQPKKLLPQYDRGDHLHPSDAGYQAMGNAISLAMFR